VAIYDVASVQRVLSAVAAEFLKTNALSLGTAPPV